MNRPQRLQIISLNLATGLLLIIIPLAITPLLPKPENETLPLLKIGGQIMGFLWAANVFTLTIWSAIMMIDELLGGGGRKQQEGV